MPPTLVVHAGAWDATEEGMAAHSGGVRRAARAGWAVLRGGGAAVEAVVAAVMVMEDDPALGSGAGGAPVAEGDAGVHAAVMAGKTLRVGAVAGVRGVGNPIRLAAVLVDEEEGLRTGEAARAFAAERLRRRFEEPRIRSSGQPQPADSVGAVALDAEGRIAVGSSTGGRPGSGGDAVIPGCSLHVDERAAGAVCSGWQDHVLRMGPARRAVDLAREKSSAQDACWLLVREMETHGAGRGGVIVVTPDGGMGYAFNTASMAVALIDRDLPEPLVKGISGARMAPPSVRWGP